MIFAGRIAEYVENENLGHDPVNRADFVQRMSERSKQGNEEHEKGSCRPPLIR